MEFCTLDFQKQYRLKREKLKAQCFFSLFMIRFVSIFRQRRKNISSTSEWTSLTRLSPWKTRPDQICSGFVGAQIDFCQVWKNQKALRKWFSIFGRNTPTVTELKALPITDHINAVTCQRQVAILELNTCINVLDADSVKDRKVGVLNIFQLRYNVTC